MQMPAGRLEAVGVNKGLVIAGLQSLRAPGLSIEQPQPRSKSAKWGLKITQSAMVMRRSYWSISNL